MHCQGACILITCIIGGATVAGTWGASTWCSSHIECSTSNGSLRCDLRRSPNEPSGCNFIRSLSSCAFSCMVLLVMSVRKRVRTLHGIAPGCCGERCDDCCTACCCLPLASSQIIRHLDARERREAVISMRPSY